MLETLIRIAFRRVNVRVGELVKAFAAAGDRI
jgi:hypothetical protein